ncbi:MAG: hypothetical protein ACK50J_16170 [Planctomyces sp.]
MTRPTRISGDIGRCLLLFLLGCGVFAPTFQTDFLNWDDPAYITHNELIKSWSPQNLGLVATESVTRNYAPITIFSFLLDHTFWGMNPSGYHATNVLLHALNGLLVYLLVAQVTGNKSVGWVTAALFLVHPVQVETVAWISSRKGILSGTFILAALLHRLRPAASPGEDGWYIGMLVAALLSKALAVVVPPIVLFYDLLVRREKFSDAVVRQFIPGLLSLLLMLHTMGAQNSILGGVRTHMDLPLYQILAVDVTILCHYIRMHFWPHDLCVLYDPPVTGIAGQVCAGLIVWAGALAIFWKHRSRQPLWLWSTMAFLLLLFPVMNIFRITTLMNDRYLYLPCIIVFAMVSSAAEWLLRESEQRLRGTAEGLRSLLRTTIRAAGPLAATSALVISAIQTNQYLPVWKNSESLWNHAMKHVPQLTVVRIQLALTLHDEGRPKEAIEIMQTALKECQPDDQDRRRMQEAIVTWSDEIQHLASSGNSSD